MSSNSWAKLKSCAWVPMPPSKIRSDSAYDDCVLRILKRAQQFELSLDIRELLIARSNRDPAHNPGSKRPSVADHFKNLILDEKLKAPLPTAFIIFDDVITSGASFKAAQQVLRNHFPRIPVIGVFVARNIKVMD
jgi:predicted amidophosphoribosyltransferase